MRCHPFTLMAAVLVGCGTRESSSGAGPDAGRSADHFQFLQSGMAMGIVTNRVGQPDRQLGSGQVRWEYDLADGSQRVIFPTSSAFGDVSTWQVAWFGQQRGTDWLWTKPADYK